MKHALIAIVLVATPGCLLELLGTTAIQGELAAENATAATGALRQAQKVTQEVSIDTALRQYRAEHGGNPRSLNELVPDYLVVLPKGKDGAPYNYNPRTGQVSLPSVRSTLSITENRDMKNMKNAIRRYKNQTGYYPPSIKALNQFGYLTSVPKTADGRDYFYNPSNGTLLYPGPTRVPRTFP